MEMPPYHPPKKYSVRIDGHRTSISLEPMFWEMLTAAAAARSQSINALVAQIDAERIRAATPPGRGPSAELGSMIKSLSPRPSRSWHSVSRTPSLRCCERGGLDRVSCG